MVSDFGGMLEQNITDSPFRNNTAPVIYNFRSNFLIGKQYAEFLNTV